MKLRSTTPQPRGIATEVAISTVQSNYHLMKKATALKRQVSEAILACQDKKAEQVTILELEKDSGAFTDYFVVCSGTNPRQIQAIADAVDDRLEALGLRPTHSEGYKQAEWVLLDYVDFVVHIFSEKARQYYDLERLWKSATRLEAAELTAAPKRRKAAARPAAAGARKKRA
jgi:ribosome-associated protein